VAWLHFPVLAVLLAGLPVAEAQAGVLPYPVRRSTLPNGLDVVVIEMPEFKGVVSWNTLVLAGSGHETEKGRTGLAHLFEHILFRHRWGGVDGGYDDVINRMGAHNNAWTWFDVTFYHPLTFTANLEPRGGLPGLPELEASRFKALDFNENTFKVEAGAVLGEYRKRASSPSEKLSERLADLLAPGEPYGHTTLGYLEDVTDMPNHYESARRFYETFYRPNNCVLVVAGDVRSEEVLGKARAAYGDWKAAGVPKVSGSKGAPAREAVEHVPWDADVAPVAWVAYKMPAFRPGSPGSAATHLLGELLVSPAAPLYRKLRYEKKTASSLGLEEGKGGFEGRDPRWIIVAAELFKDKHQERGQAYFDEVTQDIASALDELKTFGAQPGSAELLKVVQSKYRYDFLAELSSPAQVASTFSWYYRFGRDPEVLDRLLESVEKLTPQDIEDLARSAFIPEKRAVLTMAYQPKGSGQGSEGVKVP